MGKKRKKIEVWTESYQPFRMGGDLYIPVKTTVEGKGPYDLGSGYFGYLVTAPDGSTRVAESATGALIGLSLNQVRADIRGAKEEVLKRQMERAKKRLKCAETLSAERFWKMMKAGKG